MAVMMSDLERIRGRPWPRVPWVYRLWSLLPVCLGGVSLPRLVVQRRLLGDDRDAMEWLNVRFLRLMLRPHPLAEREELMQCIDTLNWRMRLMPSPADRMRPGVWALLQQAHSEYSEQVNRHG